MSINSSRLAIRNSPVTTTETVTTTTPTNTTTTTNNNNNNTDGISTPRRAQATTTTPTTSLSCMNPYTPNKNIIRGYYNKNTPSRMLRTTPVTPRQSPHHYHTLHTLCYSKMCKSPNTPVVVVGGTHNYYSMNSDQPLEGIRQRNNNNAFDCSMTAEDYDVINGQHSDIIGMRNNNNNNNTQGSDGVNTNNTNVACSSADRFIGSRPSIECLLGKGSSGRHHQRFTPPFKNITPNSHWKEEDNVMEEDESLFSDSVLTDPSVCNPLLYGDGNNAMQRSSNEGRLTGANTDYGRPIGSDNRVEIDDPSSLLQSGRRILNFAGAQEQRGNMNIGSVTNGHLGNTMVDDGRGSAAGLALSPPSTSVAYTKALVESLSLGKKGHSQSVLGLHSPNKPIQSQSASERFKSSQGVLYQQNKVRNFQSHSFRLIPQTPDRILDAPELLDDFYLNLLDWSSRNNLAVALANTCYLWNADSGSITQLMSTQEAENIVTAVAWHSDGKILAVGLQSGDIQLWDADLQKSRNIECHSGRVCSLSWNGYILASGSRDTTIRLHDLRNDQVSILLQGHTQEVCGLRWSPNGQQLASGGNDNLLNIWDVKRTSLDTTLQWQLSDHSAAIKAIAWNPTEPNILVTGGGTACKTLRFWNTATGESLHVVNTDSQVCGVMWNHEGTELISSHGYSDNQLTIWKYPSMKKIANLKGHTSRVLHLAMSPDGRVVVSAAGDETIRFWRCFGPTGGNNQLNDSGSPLNDTSLPSLGQQHQNAGSMRRRGNSVGRVYDYYYDNDGVDNGDGGSISASLIGKKLPFPRMSSTTRYSTKYNDPNNDPLSSNRRDDNAKDDDSDYDCGGLRFNKDDWLLQTDIR